MGHSLMLLSIPQRRAGCANVVGAALMLLSIPQRSAGRARRAIHLTPRPRPQWAGSRLLASATGFRAKRKGQGQGPGPASEGGGEGGAGESERESGGGAPVDGLLTSLLARESTADVAAAVADQHARELAAARRGFELQLAQVRRGALRARSV